jgi:uncharacterized protein GlcG (DUF336 family)
MFCAQGRFRPGFAHYAGCFLLSANFCLTDHEDQARTRTLRRQEDRRRRRGQALKNKWAVTISIVDDGGHLLWLQRMDGAAPISSHISPAKARTAAVGRKDTKAFEDMINNGRTAFLSAPFVDGLLEGGVAIVKDGQVLGAVGVSGVKASEDAQVASAGIAALGL